MILQEIAEATRKRVALEKEELLYTIKGIPSCIKNVPPFPCSLIGTQLLGAVANELIIDFVEKSYNVNDVLEPSI